MDTHMDTNMDTNTVTHMDTYMDSQQDTYLYAQFSTHVQLYQTTTYSTQRSLTSSQVPPMPACPTPSHCPAAPLPCCPAPPKSMPPIPAPIMHNLSVQTNYVNTVTTDLRTPLTQPASIPCYLPLLLLPSPPSYYLITNPPCNASPARKPVMHATSTVKGWMTNR